MVKAGVVILFAKKRKDGGVYVAESANLRGETRVEQEME
jgi:hypothetical protein